MLRARYSSLTPLVALLGALLGSTVAAAATVVVDFDDAPIVSTFTSTSAEIHSFATPYVEDDFVLRTAQSHRGTEQLFGLGSFGDDDGRFVEPGVMTFNIHPTRATLARVDGGAFDLVSIDLSKYSPNWAAPTLLFTGHLASGGTVEQSVTLNASFGLHTFALSGFAGLASVEWENTAGTSVFHQFDDIVLEAGGGAAPGAAPEPGAVALAFCGVLMGLGCRRRRTARG